MKTRAPATALSQGMTHELKTSTNELVGQCSFQAGLPSVDNAWKLHRILIYGFSQG